MVEFVIPGELPDMNQIIKASKSHYMAYSTMKKKYTELVMIASSKLPKVEKADFEITWVCKNKRKDKDNITAGQKFIFDGLVKSGVLSNDGWKEIGNVQHKFEVDKNDPRIVVKLSGVNAVKQNDVPNKPKRIQKATTEIYKMAREKANTEFEYRQALSKEITTLKASGVQTTLIPDVARGNVAELKLKRDLADGMYRSAIESLKALQAELSGLQTITKYQSDIGD